MVMKMAEINGSGCKPEPAIADETLRIKVDGACYTFRIGEFGEEELIKIKVLIHKTLLEICEHREYLWHKLRQINGELDRRVNEKACEESTPCTPASGGQ